MDGSTTGSAIGDCDSTIEEAAGASLGEVGEGPGSVRAPESC
ncbi:hypothetical protein RBWH47_02538 [Rhodopirellula baltica WH47]|uniref:Uncharacterized protein n=1 Tax=Rhodopirellula baltica WH47 TaxID=991778 RepID=F2AMQ6_RHOBT|nr:hypothetical protein RBWH47_02538 [Rhodopirellula baltica WH47]